MPSRGTRRAHRCAPVGKRADGRRWSAYVTEHSHAMDLEGRVFKRSPREIARSLKRSAERSANLKSSPFRSAMSMLTFYENRAGRSLPPSRREAIHKAKDELRRLYGRPVKGSGAARGRARGART